MSNVDQSLITRTMVGLAWASVSIKCLTLVPILAFAWAPVLPKNHDNGILTTISSIHWNEDPVIRKIVIILISNKLLFVVLCKFIEFGELKAKLIYKYNQIHMKYAIVLIWTTSSMSISIITIFRITGPSFQIIEEIEVYFYHVFLVKQALEQKVRLALRHLSETDAQAD